MLAIILLSLLSILLFVGFGRAYVQYTKLPATGTEILLLGLCISNTLASYLSIGMPLSSKVLLGLLALSILVSKKSPKREMVQFIKQYQATLWMSLPFIVIALLIAIGVPNNYDTGLYHLQSIKWIETYPAVPGLANLHGRFGFNPNIFTLFALTAAKDLFSQEVFVLNFTVFIIVLTYLLHQFKQSLLQSGFTFLGIWYAILLIMLLKLPNLAAPSPDYLTTVLPLFLFARWKTIGFGSSQTTLSNYIPFLTLSVYVITIKLAAIPILLLSLALLVKHPPTRRQWLYLLLWLSFIVLPWLLRNVILSGWLIYPLEALDIFNFDWKVPAEKVALEKWSLTGWARDPGPGYLHAATLSFGSWFPIWWKHLSMLNSVLLMGGVVLPILLCVAHFTKKAKIFTDTLVMILVAWAGIVFWLFLAPDWRFGEIYIIVAASAFLPLLEAFLPKMQFYQLNWKFGAVLLCGLFLAKHQLMIRTNVQALMHQQNLWTPLPIALPASPGFTVNKGAAIEVNVPIIDDRCFNFPLPCTPFPDSCLELRRNDLRDGFKLKSK
jgi:hypothetical protein